MNYLDVYYRALRSYRELTTNNRDCTAFRKAIATVDTEHDELTITRNICTVDEDWIEAIEEGLIFIEKAIKEERQFIYSNGEVVPIEKVKHVSKDSVQHLAKHSNLITKKQEGEDIIPDQLYNVERLNDYAVYENRFLYMLLCYLRDFVTIRYDKILDMAYRYDGVLRLHKKVSTSSQKITYTVDLHEERKNDRYLRENNPAKEIIDRIDFILKAIVAFLATPLMEIAGKAAKLKPPITKTNVLKMDNNFKRTVALYDFIIAYDKPGYTCEEQRVELAPFGEALADELSEAGAMMSFLTYEYGLGLNKTLKENYQAEERRRKNEQILQGEQQLQALKKRLEKMEIEPAEYILAVEKQMKLMQSELRQVEPLRNRVAELKASEEALTEQVKMLTKEGEELREQIAEEQIRHRQEVERINAEHAAEIHELMTRHDEEMRELMTKHDEAMRELMTKHAEAVRELEEKHREAIEQIRVQMQETENVLSERIVEAKQAQKSAEERSASLEADNAALIEKMCAAEARIKALRLCKGDTFGDGDFMEQEDFGELERELDAFISFYEDRWEKVKRSIRKKLLNYQALKEMSRRG